MTTPITAAQSERIDSNVRAGLHELLMERPELLDLGVENVSAIFRAGVICGAKAIIEVVR